MCLASLRTPKIDDADWYNSIDWIAPVAFKLPGLSHSRTGAIETALILYRLLVSSEACTGTDNHFERQSRQISLCCEAFLPGLHHSKISLFVPIVSGTSVKRTPSPILSKQSFAKDCKHFWRSACFSLQLLVFRSPCVAKPEHRSVEVGLSD